MGDHRNLDAVQRCAHGGAEDRLVALVVGMGHQGDTRGDENRAGGVDDHVAGAVGARETDLVIRARALTIFEFGLGDGGLEVDVPQRGCFLRVGLAAGEIAQEGALAHTSASLVDGGVEIRPVDRESETAEEIFEDLLVLVCELFAQLDEVGTRDRHRLMVLGRIASERRLEVGLVGHRRIASDPEEVLHSAFGRQPVVVPSHGIEDRLAAHALMARDGVGVGVREDVAHVERTRHGGRWRVDRVHLFASGRAVEAVDAFGLPGVDPELLDAVEAGLLGDLGHGSPG